MEIMSRVTSVVILGCQRNESDPLHLLRGSPFSKAEEQAHYKSNDTDYNSGNFLVPEPCTGQVERGGEKDRDDDQHADNDQDDP